MGKEFPKQFLICSRHFDAKYLLTPLGATKNILILIYSTSHLKKTVYLSKILGLLHLAYLQ
jgi:hypothetical protein